MVLALLGCQQPQPSYTVERSRSYQQDKAVVWNKTLQFLQANNITVRSSDPASGVIEANRKNYQDAGWADCALARRTDRDGNRPRRARQRIDRDLSLAIRVGQAASTTTVRLDARFTERQIHPWRNLPFRTRCISKGVLESALLNAI